MMKLLILGIHRQLKTKPNLVGELVSKILFIFVCNKSRI